MQNEQQLALSNIGITALNPMQETAHKTILTKNEIVLIAPTGSGKTIGFLLPLLQLLEPSLPSIQCLILVPSRELALQIEQVWKKMGTGLKVNVCYGGHDARTEAKNLTVPPALLIGTPGRIADHVQRGRVNLDTIKTLILDEFDKSLELGFQSEMEYILGGLTNLTKKVMVSATESLEIPEFAKVNEPTTLNFASKEKHSASDLTMKLVISEDRDKLQTLFQLLCSLSSEPALIFCNHRDACERATTYLNEQGIIATFYHGGMEQNDRERALIQFRNGSVNYLVTTDLAARGLDIPEMKNVIHFQLPIHENEFTHRNGRTARMHAKGTAYLLMSRNEKQPEYIQEQVKELQLPKKNQLPEPPLFQTLYINGGKKTKLNKFDIVGCFLQKGKLAKEDLGLIEVQDFNSFVAVKIYKVQTLLHTIKDEKIKGKKYKMGVAK